MTRLADPHAGARARAERLFVRGRLGDRSFRALLAHLRDCPDCRAHYDRLSAVKRALDPESALIPWDELALHARAGAAAAAGRSARRPFVAAALGLAGAATLAALLLVTSRPQAGRDEFTARGAARAASSVGIRAFCLSPAAAVVSTGELSPSPVLPLRCEVADSLQFAYTFPARPRPAGPVRLWLLSTEGAGPPNVYDLGPVDGAVTLTPGARDQPIANTIRLAVRHHPGSYRLMGVASARALSPREVAKAAAGEPVRGAEVTSLPMELR